MPVVGVAFFFFSKQKTAYGMRISDWSSDVCSSDLLQASANGVAIVASKAGGIPEAVRDGVNGVLVPPHEVAPLADAIIALANDDARRSALGAAGRRLIADEFSVDAMVEGNLAVYQELLGKMRPPHA